MNLLLVLSLCIMLCSCKSSDNTLSTSEAISSPVASEPVLTEPSTIDIVSESSDSLSLQIVIANDCGVDIGMFSVIDPRNNEQINMGAIKNGESLNVTADWPVGTKEFQWALYNGDGDLCIESKTDISQAKTAVVLHLTGNGNLENVDEYFE